MTHPNGLQLRCSAGGVEEMLTVDMIRKVRLLLSRGESLYNDPQNLYKVLSSEPRRKKGVNVRHGSGEEAAHRCV